MKSNLQFYLNYKKKRGQKLRIYKLSAPSILLAGLLVGHLLGVLSLDAGLFLVSLQPLLNDLLLRLDRYVPLLLVQLLIVSTPVRVGMSS